MVFLLGEFAYFHHYEKETLHFFEKVKCTIYSSFRVFNWIDHFAKTRICNERLQNAKYTEKVGMLYKVFCVRGEYVRYTYVFLL